MRALRRALAGLGEHRLLAVAAASSVAVVLMLTGAFALVVDNLSSLVDRWGRDVQIACYLRDDVAEDRVFDLRAELLAIEEVASVAYVSKDEALQRLADALPGERDLLADLDGNPLPASLDVRLKPKFQDPATVEAVGKRMQRDEFEDVDWAGAWVGRFHAFVGLMRLSAVALGGLLLLATIFLVSNTMRLALYARRDELRIVRLVGGTEWFVAAPFVVEGALLGLGGALVAWTGLAALWGQAFRRSERALGLLLGSDASFFGWAGTLLLLCAGFAVGVLGAATAVLSAERDP
jgi:cell division transport system permease protein